MTLHCSLGRVGGERIPSHDGRTDRSQCGRRGRTPSGAMRLAPLPPAACHSARPLPPAADEVRAIASSTHRLPPSPVPPQSPPPPDRHRHGRTCVSSCSALQHASGTKTEDVREAPRLGARDEATAERAHTMVDRTTVPVLHREPCARRRLLCAVIHAQQRTREMACDRRENVRRDLVRREAGAGRWSSAQSR